MTETCTSMYLRELRVVDITAGMDEVGTTTVDVFRFQSSRKTNASVEVALVGWMGATWA